MGVVAGRMTAWIAMVVLVFAVSTAGVDDASAAGARPAPSQMRFVNVVKLTGVNWFNRMESGLEAFAKKTGVRVEQTGPAEATAEGQVSIIQNLIPQKPTVIGVVPNNQQALEGVLARAQAAHIIVVSQEASQLQHTDFDLEAFSNAEYGASMMDALATCMGGKGQYAAFVGHLTAQSHMEWVQGALDEAKKKYPGITRVTDPVESNEDANVAYQKTKALLAKYPRLRGFEGSAATDVVGIARAVTELGLAGKVCIVGTSLPSLTRDYIEKGTIYRIFLWDPALAGEATMYAALMLAEGKPIRPGTNLGVPGYTHIQPCGGNTSPHCYRGTAQLAIGKDNIAQYNF
jgi:simple sugar transport system substrate-binding protein